MYPATFDDCGGPHDLTDKHSISSWEAKPTTCAEQAVIQYLGRNPKRFRGQRILHVGIGNGALFELVNSSIASFTGITISKPEIASFRQRFRSAARTSVLLANKHDERSFELVGHDFDLIIDVNLKSFACCERHFLATMEWYGRSLRTGGSILTAQSGLDFGWAGNTNVAFTPGAHVDPSTSSHRVLGTNGLLQLARNFGLSPVSIVVPASVLCSGETLWLLEKR